jgi:hypothetical protein
MWRWTTFIPPRHAASAARHGLFFIRRVHDRQFMFEDSETESFEMLQQAQERYEIRRLALVRRGYVHSDMDF